MMSIPDSKPVIKEEVANPNPIMFTRDISVIDKDLEIVDFVPAHEVSQSGREVKEEQPEGAR